jgi:hypothetical protein
MTSYLRLRWIGWRERFCFANALGRARVNVACSIARSNATTALDPAAFRPATHAEPDGTSSTIWRPAFTSVRPVLLSSAGPLLKIVRNGVIGLIAMIALGIVLFGAGLFAVYDPPKTFEAKHLRNARPAIVDRDGELVGAAPGFRQIAASTAGEVTDDEARMAALMVRDVPPVWWDVAVALEDRRFGKFGWVYGIDLIALPLVLIGTRGGSTLPMQVVGNLSGDKAREVDERKSSRMSRLVVKVKRKLRELSSAPSLVASTSDDDYLWFKRLAATHLPVIHGEIGGSTVGIASGAWVMFGKTPTELGPGEAAIFAAALKRNITIKKQPDEKVLRDWSYVKDRARRGLALAYSGSDSRRVQGIAEIDAMPETPPLFFNDALPLTARAHVVYRRAILARTVTTEAQAELADRYGLTVLREMPLRGYSLTLSSMDNFHFKQRMDVIAATVTEKLGRECKLFIPLVRTGFAESTYRQITGRPHCAPADLPPTERAQVLAVLANERGEIVRFYQSGSYEPIYAGVIGRGSNDGRYKPEAEIRDIGSVAKVLAAILLAREGDSPDQRYCRQSFDGRLDSDGTTGVESCTSPGAMIDAREAFARSSNLAVLWRLRQIPKEKLRGIITDFGFKSPTNVDPAYAIAFGLIQAAPQQVHNLMHSLGRVVLGRGKAGSRIHVIRHLDLSEAIPASPAAESTIAVQLPAYLANDQARTYVRDVLAAVLSHPAGTMRFLRAYTHLASHDAVSAHIGKTGTPVGEGNLVSDKLVTGSLIQNGRYYSYLFLVRAANPGKLPLGRHLKADYFAPMITALLNEITDADAGKVSGRKLIRTSLTVGSNG